jgi:16S rRNA processing protein RimM
VAAPARLVVGRVLRPHGVRGEMTVEVLSDADERFSPGAKLAAGDPDDPASLHDLEVESARLHQGRMLLRLAGISDRDAVEPLRGQLLSIPLEDARELGPDEYWPHQLTGLRVVDSHGRERGVVADVLPGAAHDLLEVRRSDGETVLVPVVAALVTVQLEAGRVVVQALPGLLAEDG